VKGCRTTGLVMIQGFSFLLQKWFVNHPNAVPKINSVL